jgi:transposase-like protein
MGHELERLQSRHLAIVEMVLEGRTVADIARALDMHPNGVSRITQAPIFQDVIARRRREQQAAVDASHASGLVKTKEALIDASHKAVSTLAELLDGSSENIKLRAAEAVLDRAFGLGDDKGLGGTNISALTQINFVLMRTALREADGLPGVDTSDLIEGEVCEGGTVPASPTAPSAPSPSLTQPQEVGA